MVPPRKSITLPMGNVTLKEQVVVESSRENPFCIQVNPCAMFGPSGSTAGNVVFGGIEITVEEPRLSERRTLRDEKNNMIVIKYNNEERTLSPF